MISQRCLIDLKNKLSVGVSMLSSIMGNFDYDEEEVLVVQQLGDMYEVSASISLQSSVKSFFNHM